MGLYNQADVTKVTSSSVVSTKQCILFGMLLGLDGANDPTITIYNGTDNTGTELVPTNDYDASALNLNGLTIPYGKKAYNGIYVEITCAGAVEVVIDYKEIGR
jgi:hypothetical protein